MFTTYSPTRRLLAKSQTKHAPNVKEYTQDWEKDVTNELAVTKTALQCCSQDERRYYKEKTKTLDEVLHRLKGKKAEEKKNNQREEMESLKMQLQEVTSDYEKKDADYTLHKTLNADLKIQLSRQFKSTNDAVTEIKALRGKVQSMTDLYNQRLNNSLPVKDVNTKTSGVASLQQATYRSVAAALSDQRQIMTEFRIKMDEAERKLNVSQQTFLNMKDAYCRRLENCRLVRDVQAKAAGVPSLQQAAYQITADTLSIQRQLISQLRDNLNEAETKLQQATQSFLIKERELQNKIQALEEKMERQKSVDTRRTNVFILCFRQLCRWVCSIQRTGATWI